MKIGVIGTRGFPGIQGGVEKHCERLYPRLPAQCQLVVFRRRSYVRSPATYPRIEFVDLPSTRVRGLEAALHSLLATLACIRRRPDLAHVHNIGPAFFSPLLRLAGIPVVLTFHSPNYEHRKWGRVVRRLLKFSETVALRAANAVIFVNQFQMQKYNSAIQQKSQYIPNGVEMGPATEAIGCLARLGLTAGRFVLAVGRITPEKGFGLLIDAFQRLPLGDQVLVIAGGVANETAHLRELKAQAGNSAVVFAGHLDEPELAQLFRHARLFVLSSVNEGFPLVLLEAMAAGCDVLASDIPASHLVSLASEDYFDPQDAGDLAAKLQRKLSQPRPGRQYDLSAFDWGQIAARTLAVYEKILQRGGGARSGPVNMSPAAEFTCSSRC